MISRTALITAMALSFGLGMAPAANAWDLIGAQTVKRGVDRDVVNVRGKERYRQFRMCVNVAGIQVRDLDLRYANGNKQDVKVRRYIDRASCTRTIDLKGKRRDIARVMVTYKKVGPGPLSVVTFWAR